MLRRSLLALSLIVLASPLVSQTAAPPDLSGTWVFNAAKSKLAKTVVLQSETLVIKCAGNSIHVAIAWDGKESTEMYVVDGKEHTDLNVQGGGQLYSKAQWKKSTLITETGGRVRGIDGGDFEIMHDKVQWTLSADGRTLTREFDDPKQTFVYDKQ